MSDQPPTEEDLQDLIEAAQEARREFEAYEGDEYLLEGWVDDNTSRDDVIAELSDPFTLSVLLSMNGLECILADKHATAGLKKLLIQGHPGILGDLAAYAKQRKPKGKPGPKPKDGKKYLKQKIAELDAKGLSNGKIAKIIYNTPAKANVVAAHLHQFRKKIPTRPAEQRPSNK